MKNRCFDVICGRLEERYHSVIWEAVSSILENINYCLPDVKNIETCSALTAKSLFVNGEWPSMNVIRSWFGPPWYLCKVLNFCKSAFGTPSVCPTTNPFPGSWIADTVLTFLCLSSSFSLDFENNFRTAFETRPRFGLLEPPILSNSSDSESLHSSSGCKWTSFWRVRTIKAWSVYLGALLAKIKVSSRNLAYQSAFVRLFVLIISSIASL